MLGTGPHIWITQRGPERLPWVYPPAFALLFWPLARLPLSVGFCLNAIGMLLCCVGFSVLAARIYRVPVRLAALATFAWQPALIPISFGQNSDLALLLAGVFTFAVVTKREALAGVSVGLLLFKPTDAVAFALLLAVRRNWKALGIVAAFAALWYLASVPTAGGDWTWPSRYLESVRPWALKQLGDESLIGVTALAIQMGAASTTGLLISASLLVAWIPVVWRSTALEAASFAGVLAVATSAHANAYEASMLLPALFYVLLELRGRLRAWIFSSAYVIGATSIYMRAWTHLFPMRFLVLILTLGYLATGLRTALGSRRPASL